MKRSRPGVGCCWSDRQHFSSWTSQPSKISIATTTTTTSFARSIQGILPLSQPKRCLSSSAYSGASRNESFDDALAALPPDAQLQFDFFGEPITFLGLQADDRTANAMVALDGFLLAIASKGRTCTGGGTEQGLEMQSAHASAIQWAELLRHAKVWNTVENDQEENEVNAADADKKTKDTEKDDNENDTEADTSNETSNDNQHQHQHQQQQQRQKGSQSKKKSPNRKFSPMLAVAAIAPVMAQAGPGYVSFLDKLLKHGDSLVPGMGPLQMMPLAEAAVQRKDDRLLNERERDHIHALDLMMQYNHETALLTYLRILRKCPGDILALSLAIDLASMLGDKDAALRYVTSVLIKLSGDTS